MLLSRIRDKMGSDRGAVASVETILLIAVAVLSVMLILKYIITPMQESSKGIGNEIEKMNPE